VVAGALADHWTARHGPSQPAKLAAGGRGLVRALRQGYSGRAIVRLPAELRVVWMDCPDGCPPPRGEQIVVLRHKEIAGHEAAECCRAGLPEEAVPRHLAAEVDDLLELAVAPRGRECGDGPNRSGGDLVTPGPIGGRRGVQRDIGDELLDLVRLRAPTIRGDSGLGIVNAGPK
jgi:hypothetical protein